MPPKAIILTVVIVYFSVSSVAAHGACQLAVLFRLLLLTKRYRVHVLRDACGVHVLREMHAGSMCCGMQTGCMHIHVLYMHAGVRAGFFACEMHARYIRDAQLSQVGDGCVEAEGAKWGCPCFVHGTRVYMSEHNNMMTISHGYALQSLTLMVTRESSLPTSRLTRVPTRAAGSWAGSRAASSARRQASVTPGTASSSSSSPSIEWRCVACIW